MTEALIMMGGLGLVIGLVLAVAAKAFYVYVDPQVEAVASALHGANCGGCGKPGCGANAEAIVAGQASPNSCVAAGPEVAEAIAALLGVAVTAMEPNIARPGCYPAGSAASRFGRRHLRRRQAGAGFRQALPGARGPDGNDPFQRALGQEPAGGRGRRRRRVRRPEHCHAAAIQKLFGEAGRLTGVEVAENGKSQVGRLAAQTLILSAGRFPEMIFVPSGAASPPEEGAPAAPAGWEGILPYKQPWYRDQSGLYAEGDVTADYSAAIKAIGAGRRAAASIHQVLSGIAPQLSEKVIDPKAAIQNVSTVENIKPFPRQIMPVCSGTDLMRCGELERGYSEDAARKEAGRCLQCG